MKIENRTHMCAQLNETNVGEEVCIKAWVHKKRELSKRIFLILRDRTGLIQVVFDQEKNAELFEFAKQIKHEYILSVTGLVILRHIENVNDNMKTGKIEIEASTASIISISKLPPFQIDDQYLSTETRLKYRFLDLRRPEMQHKLKVRHQVNQLVRNFLSEEGFLELDTPILAKSSPEGARDYLVPSRVHPGSFYALPQSPQLFKQLLMISGFDRYFQIAKCFRDEDLRADRQPEFTQIDIEMSFINEEDIMRINERLIATIFKEILGFNISLPLQRMPYHIAMKNYGSDKPDLRFEMSFIHLNDIFKTSNFPVFQQTLQNNGSIIGINAKKSAEKLSRKKIDALIDFVKIYKAKGLFYIIFQENGEIKSSLTKYLSEKEIKELTVAANANPGDILFFLADKASIAHQAMGQLRLELAKQLELIPENTYSFLWVYDFPLLEFDEEENRFVPVHHPFTSPNEEDIHLLKTNPEKVRARAYDMILNGTEIGGGSIRIHDLELQKTMFSLLGYDEKTAQERFGFLLDAFHYGVPPHGGIAYGLDRLVMILTASESIRDVICFPKSKDASCLLTNAPSAVLLEQLQELSLEIKEK